jgi:hypothetical protein
MCFWFILWVAREKYGKRYWGCNCSCVVGNALQLWPCYNSTIHISMPSSKSTALSVKSWIISNTDSTVEHRFNDPWLRLCNVAILNTGWKMKHCCQFFMSPPIIGGYKCCQDHCGNGTKLAEKAYKCQPGSRPANGLQRHTELTSLSVTAVVKWPDLRTNMTYH